MGTWKKLTEDKLHEWVAKMQARDGVLRSVDGTVEQRWDVKCLESGGALVTFPSEKTKRVMRFHLGHSRISTQRLMERKSPLGLNLLWSGLYDEGDQFSVSRVRDLTTEPRYFFLHCSAPLLKLALPHVDERYGQFQEYNSICVGWRTAEGLIYVVAAIEGKTKLFQYVP